MAWRPFGCKTDRQHQGGEDVTSVLYKVVEILVSNVEGEREERASKHLAEEQEQRNEWTKDTGDKERWKDVRENQTAETPAQDVVKSIMGQS
jgi:hypothetical protein